MVSAEAATVVAALKVICRGVPGVICGFAGEKVTPEGRPEI
jgi:hypothetical protein